MRSEATEHVAWSGPATHAAYIILRSQMKGPCFTCKLRLSSCKAFSGCHLSAGFPRRSPHSPEGCQSTWTPCGAPWTLTCPNESWLPDTSPRDSKHVRPSLNGWKEKVIVAVLLLEYTLLRWWEQQSNVSNVSELVQHESVKCGAAAINFL